jgi:hypothetical protein
MLKFLVSFVLVILTSCPFLAQVQISAEDSVEIATIQKQWSEDSFQKGVLQQHPISKINDIYYVSFLGKINENFDKGSLLSNQYIVGNPIQSIVSLKIPVQKLGDLYQLQGVQFLALASKSITNWTKPFTTSMRTAFTWAWIYRKDIKGQMFTSALPIGGSIIPILFFMTAP